MPLIVAVNLHPNPLSLNTKREVEVTCRTSRTNNNPRTNSIPRTNRTPRANSIPRTFSIPLSLRSRHLRLGPHRRNQLGSQLIMLSLWNSSSSILS